MVALLIAQLRALVAKFLDPEKSALLDLEAGGTIAGGTTTHVIGILLTGLENLTKPEFVYLLPTASGGDIAKSSKSRPSGNFFAGGGNHGAEGSTRGSRPLL